MILEYAGTFKQHLLMDELLVAFPGWIVGEGDDRQCLLYLEGNSQGVRLTVPDVSDEQAISLVVNAHDPNVLSPGEIVGQDIEAAVTGFKNLPNYATWTPTEAEDYVHDNVLNGWNKTEADAWIDANVTNLAEAKTALKLIAGALIDIRNILSQIVKIIMWLRNIIIRTR